MDLPEPIPFSRLLDEVYTRIASQVARSYDEEIMRIWDAFGPKTRWYTPR